MSQSAVSRIWRAFGLKPHVVQTWKLSTDPQFIDKVRDVVGLYMSPPENALVLCVDEKSQIQALDRTAPCLPMLPDDPGADDPRLRPQRHHQPVRRVRPGQRLGDRPALPPAPPPGVPAVPQAHRRAPCRKDLDLHLVLDNYATHKTPAIHQWLLKHPRFHLHFTPTSSSLAEPGRALVRRAHEPQAPQVSPPQRHRTRNRHPQVDQRVEQGPQAVRVDQDRRRDPGNPRRLL